MRILVVTAAEEEADSVRKIAGMERGKDRFFFGKTEIVLLVTGVGPVSTAWMLTRWLSENPLPELAINIGIAGSYRENPATGDVVVPVSDCFADTGIETPEGFLTLFEAGLADPEAFPFTGGRIVAGNHFIQSALTSCKPVSAITVSKASGTAETIEKIKLKFDPDIETMEGAAFFYICSREKLPFLAIRAVSNRVEPRDRNKWNIQFALDNLSEKLKDFLLILER